MKNEEFFDEMQEALQRAADHRRFEVDPAVWQAFFADRPAPAAQSAPGSAPSRRMAAPAEPQRDFRPEPEYRPQDSAPLPPRREVPPPDDPAPVIPETPDYASMDMGALAACAGNCRRCRLAATRRNVVFGEGDPRAELMFIGEGPGADEDASGRPFVGTAGQLLDKMIAAMQFTRESVYIGNVVKCRPPGNRTPQDDEAAACLGMIRRQIELIRPKVIVLLGATPLKFLLKRVGIMRWRGQWQEYRGIPVMPTFHPAYLLRNPAAKRDVWNDLQQVMARFGKTYSKR